MPCVSVVIPNYNHAPFLKQRIDSVLNQTYKDFEVILLDDCSTDNSKEIIEEYAAHPKVSHVVFNQTNSGGTFRQWQKGLLLAKGSYIWIAESDDYADTNFLSTLMKPFEQHQDLILSYCQSSVVDEAGNFLHLSKWADPLDGRRWKHNYIESTAVELDRFLSYRNTIPNASGVVFVKPNDLDILNASVNFRMAGDWMFWRKLLNRPGKIAYTATPLNYFRLHQQTTRHAFTQDKELARHRELKFLIVPEKLSPFNKNYDWMIINWWVHRVLLKGTHYHYLPDLPLTLLLRIPIVLFKKALSKLTRGLQPPAFEAEM